MGQDKYECTQNKFNSKMNDYDVIFWQILPLEEVQCFVFDLEKVLYWTAHYV
jgi:hypothetical protein